MRLKKIAVASPRLATEKEPKTKLTRVKAVATTLQEVVADDTLRESQDREALTISGFLPEQVEERMAQAFEKTRRKRAGCSHTELKVEHSVHFFEEECSRHQIRISVECAKCGQEFSFVNLPAVPQMTGAWASAKGTLGHFCIIPTSEIR